MNSETQPRNRARVIIAVTLLASSVVAMHRLPAQADDPPDVQPILLTQSDLDCELDDLINMVIFEITPQSDSEHFAASPRQAATAHLREELPQTPLDAVTEHLQVPQRSQFRIDDDGELVGLINVVHFEHGWRTVQAATCERYRAEAQGG